MGVLLLAIVAGAKVGIVAQTSAGVVFRCTQSVLCRDYNKNAGTNDVCLLSIDHSQRCEAWRGQSTWVITPDPKEVRCLDQK